MNSQRSSNCDAIYLIWFWFQYQMHFPMASIDIMKMFIIIICIVLVSNSLHFTTSYIIIPKEWMCILRVLTMIQGEVDYVNRIKMNQLMHNNWIKRIYFKKLFHVKTIALIYIPSTSFNKEMLLYWGSKSYHMNYSEKNRGAQMMYITWWFNLSFFI